MVLNGKTKEEIGTENYDLYRAEKNEMLKTLLKMLITAVLHPIFSTSGGEEVTTSKNFTLNRQEKGRGDIHSQKGGKAGGQDDKNP